MSERVACVAGVAGTDLGEVDERVYLSRIGAGLDRHSGFTEPLGIAFAVSAQWVEPVLVGLGEVRTVPVESDSR